MSSQPFDEIPAKLRSGVGHPEMAGFGRELRDAHTESELEAVVERAIGAKGWMEFRFFDLGDVLRKELGAKAAKSVRLLIGNPLVMKQMVKLVPDAGSYAPVTVLVDERADGVHLSDDQMASFLAPYGNVETLWVANDLDSKIQSLRGGGKMNFRSGLCAGL